MTNIHKNYIIYLSNSQIIINNLQDRADLTIYSRRQSLLEILRNQPGLRVPELAKTLGVSEGTVRNDFDALENEGRLKRVHGGAILYEQDQFQNNSFMRRYNQNVAAKRAIAREAAALIKDGDSIFLDASSTAYYLARALADRFKLRIMTNGFEVARELAWNTSNSVVLAGGIVNNDSSSVTGLLSEQIITEMLIGKSFFSCSGFSVARGMTEVHIGEAQIKRKAIESSQKVFALVDSSKFGKEDLTHFALPSQIEHLFTDSSITEDWKARLRLANIQFSVCSIDSPQPG